MESDITQFQAILNRVGAEKDEAIQSATKWAVDQSLLALRQQEEIERLRAELAAEGATTASLLRTIALIREAGGLGRERLDALPGAVKAMREQRDEARELYCRQIAYGLFRTTGVFDPKEIAIKRGWAGLFRVNEPGSPKTAAPIHREPAPTPAPPPKKFFKEGGGA